MIVILISTMLMTVVPCWSLDIDFILIGQSLQAEIGARFVEVVGLDKVNKQQSQVSQLRTVSVRGMGVSGAWSVDSDHNTRDLSAELSSLRDLDLSDSLLTNWSQPATIITQLRLETIDLSGNLLGINTSQSEASVCKDNQSEASIPSMPTLKHLILGNMLYSGYDWTQIMSIVTMTPSLTVLQVHCNHLTHITSFNVDLLARLTELDLDGNKLTDWAQLQPLSQLPQLKHLRLNGNKLTSISVVPGSFPQLETLQLTDNNICSWKDVGSLDNLQLAQLRLRNNPVINSSKDEEEARQMTIARISSLKYLNATAINQSERRWAEIDYLKSFGQQWIEISKIEDSAAKSQAMAEFLESHNRYDKIVGMYGEPEPGDGAKVDTSLKASLLRLKIRSPELIGSAETVKKIPSSMNVRALR